MSPEPHSDQSANDSAQLQPPKFINDDTADREAAKSPAAEPKSPKSDDVEPPSSEQEGDVEEDKVPIDMPQVKVSEDASRNPDYHFPQDEPVPEDLPEEEEEMPATSVTTMHPGSKMKSQQRMEYYSIIYILFNGINMIFVPYVFIYRCRWRESFCYSFPVPVGSGVLSMSE